MLILFVILWVIAAILIFIDPKTLSTRWASGLTFFSGFGGLGVVLNDNVIPLIIDLQIKETIWVVSAFILTLSHQVAPYAFMMYGITTSDLFKRFPRFLKFSPYIFFTPVALMYLIYPFIPDYNPSFLVLSVWVVPYIIFSNFLLLYSYFKEKNPKIKQQRLFSCILFAPPTLFTMMVNYVLRIAHYDDLWKYNTITIVSAFVIFVVASAKFGVMGVRLKFEKHRLESSLKALTSGAAIYDHAIKNEVFKISMCMNNIKTSVNQPCQDLQVINENIRTVQDSTEHLTSMMKRIHEQTTEIVLIESDHDLVDIIEKSLDMVKPYLEEKNIYVSKEYNSRIKISCDRVHIIELLNNIFKNAIEAMQINGKLNIILYVRKKAVTLLIKDNGTGISEGNLPYVFDLFFSTKQRTMNFGMGLSYCYNVMQKHEGKMEILSEENIGTTVILVFSKKRIMNSSIQQPQRSTVHGQN